MPRVSGSGPKPGGIGGRGVAAFRSVRALTDRERRHLLEECMKVKGLLPLLMKQRNKQRWTAEDRAELRVHVRRISSLSPYLVVLVMPGGFFVLPALAWWLDRRRIRRRGAAVPLA